MGDLVQGFRDQEVVSTAYDKTGSEKSQISQIPRFPNRGKVLDGCSPMGAGLANSLRVRGNVTNP